MTAKIELEIISCKDTLLSLDVQTRLIRHLMEPLGYHDPSLDKRVVFTCDVKKCEVSDE